MVRGERLRLPLSAFVPAILVLLSGCEAPRMPSLPVVGRPVVFPRPLATVLVVRTNVLPERKAFLHLVILGGGKARIGIEAGQWRLFDLQNHSVTFVNDVDKTYRTESFAALVRRKRGLLRGTLPPSIPPAQFLVTAHERTFGTFSSALSLIRYGGYQRSLWMSTSLAVPDHLFPMIVASEPLTTPYSPALRDVFEGMLALRGFPVIDRSDVTFGGQQHTIEKRLERVEERTVPSEWLQVPRDYRDLTPKPPPSPRARRTRTIPGTSFKIP